MNLQDAIRLIEHSSISQTMNARWVDAGCGNGLFTFALAHLLQEGGSIEALDKIAMPLQQLPNPRHISIKTTQLDFTREILPLFDLNGILMANALHYVADKLSFITSMKRHLAINGCWLIVEYDTDNPNPWVPYPLSWRLLQQLFTEAGYAQIIKLRSIPSVYNSGTMYSALIQP